MYPSRELRLLSTRKELLRRRIAAERELCVLAGARVTSPISWIDGLRTRWRHVTPLAKLVLVPLVFKFQRHLFRRVSSLAAAVRWVTVAATVLRGWRKAGN